jgi:serine/threonine-protein kinase HipA
MMRRGEVRLDGERVGIIEETERGSLFRYDAAWRARPDALPISLTLPLQEEAYESRGLLPYFENLLPEGWLLELSTAKLKIAKDDAFGLLLAVCADCIGAVEVVPFEGTQRERTTAEDAKRDGTNEHVEAEARADAPSHRP